MWRGLVKESLVLCKKLISIVWRCKIAGYKFVCAKLISWLRHRQHIWAVSTEIWTQHFLAWYVIVSGFTNPIHCKGPVFIRQGNIHTTRLLPLKDLTSATVFMYSTLASRPLILSFWLTSMWPFSIFWRSFEGVFAKMDAGTNCSNPNFFLWLKKTVNELSFLGF